MLSVAWLGLAWIPGVHAFGTEINGSEIESIKAAALDAASQAADTRQRLQWPGVRPLDLYLASGDAGLTFVSIEAAADDVQIPLDNFSPIESHALSLGGWFRIAQIDPGRAHHFHVDLRFRVGGDDAQSTPRQLQADLATAADDNAAAVVAVVESGVLGSPSLRLLPLHAASGKRGLAGRLLSALPFPGAVRDRFIAGGPYDPVLRHALFLRHTREYLDAAVQLRRYGADSPAPLEPHYELATAQGMLDLGLPAQALALEPRWRFADTDSALQLKRDIAALYYRRGNYRAADNALGDPPLRSRAAALLAWQDVKSQLLLAQGRMNEALAVLRAVEPEAGYSGYVRYFNLGIAALASGNVAQGLTVLTRVGDMAGTNDPLMTALSDRANLTAGAHFLHQGQGATAIPLLEKVHDQGVDSNTALLDLGWAWLAPAGAEQSRSMLGDERTVGAPPESGFSTDRKWDQNLYQRFTLDPFDRAKIERSEGGRLQHALAIWGELARRPPSEDAVIEATLAIAVKLDDAGAQQTAAGYYERSIAALEQSLSSLAQTEQYLASAPAQADLYSPQPDQAFDREPHNLPPQPAADTLRRELADWPFLERLADYRDALVLARQLDDLSKNLLALRQTSCRTADDDSSGRGACAGLQQVLDTIAALQPRLAAETSNLLQQVQEPLRLSLAARRRWQTKLLIDSRFALAKLNDHPLQ